MAPFARKQRFCRLFSGKTYFKSRGVPLSSLAINKLELDELEAMQLCDYEDLHQAEAAERIGVSSSTLQRLLYSGRRKVTDALYNSKDKIPYFCIITNPTTGGVSASFASVADIIIAEPGALFCFAGPRVIKQTIKKELPSDFGTSERNLRNGQVDMITNRSKLRDTLAKLLSLFKKD